MWSLGFPKRSNLFRSRSGRAIRDPVIRKYRLGLEDMVYIETTKIPVLLSSDHSSMKEVVTWASLVCIPRDDCMRELRDGSRDERKTCRGRGTVYVFGYFSVLLINT